MYGSFKSLPSAAKIWAVSQFEISFSREAYRGRASSDGPSLYRMTHRDMILEVLDANPQGGIAEQVIEMIS